ncbi:exopolyphosphatase [Motiliproteus sp. SC1-56]|uniref:exopolyphosphatase n=1 Tax=Motiliproteus sp. SC1-56 TaxID=2799565 RepID=UPI001A8E50AB|nr:exopolyphosphatase [Motiliproteus sp. SC1-56]
MSDAPPPPSPTAQPHYAAIDLGSNSFHLVIAREVHGELQRLDRIGERVQLAAGLDEEHFLDAPARERGLACLERFAQRLAGIPREQIRAVATNTLRAARNRRTFIQAAEAVLKIPLEVISGREEARLIYLGVAHSFADDGAQRLVVDIGGGSTELIIGQRFSPLELESLHMGCVSYTQRFFGDGKLSEKQFRKAVNGAHRELLNIKKHYRRLGWSDAVGASGTVKALHRLAAKDTDGQLTLEGLDALRQKLLAFSSVTAIDLDGIKPARSALLPGGLAILTAIFEALEIDSMRFSEGALREGVLYDLQGRHHHEDVRERTIEALMQRYHVDQEQAAAVEATALHLLTMTPFDREPNRQLLSWAARLHEAGLAISHSQFHKHGAYLIEHSDMMGFGCREQEHLAFLLRYHRRKLNDQGLAALAPAHVPHLKALCTLLRLSVVVHRSRLDTPPPALQLRWRGDACPQLRLRFAKGWLEQHPLTLGDLEQEQFYLSAWGIQLEFD